MTSKASCSVSTPKAYRRADTTETAKAIKANNPLSLLAQSGCAARAPVSCAAMSCAAAGSLTPMTSITAQTHATLDGVIDAPPADALLPYMSDAGRQGALDLALAADALLLARETWQGLARAWRDQTGPMADRLNAMPKYVVSATLRSADEWDHTTIVGYDDIAGLREREQLLTYGCGRLARDLLADGLLDVLVLSLTPVVAGTGRRLFDDPTHLVRLRLTNSTTFETGAVRLLLEPDHA
jgi:dihydrofolate reductase